jgi:3,4-dihydroxy 2-butanone 4-phosphate synthase/GTP cyclohydrolase II
MSTILIDRLNDMVGSGEMSRSGLARAAGLHPNSLRRLGESDWNPTADTLLKLERFLSNGGASGVMASAEQIIDEARNGRMFILVDDEDRENEATSSSRRRWRHPRRSISWRGTGAA